MIDDPQFKPIYEIDGIDFSTLEEFYDTISRVLISNASWGRNLDAFNDILRGCFGTPEGGFILVWKNSYKSRIDLGYKETVRVLERRLQQCHPSNRAIIDERILQARNGVGNTIFDDLVEIIKMHCAGGIEGDDNVELILD